MNTKLPLTDDERAEALRAILDPDRAKYMEAAKRLAEDETTTEDLLRLLDEEERVDNRHAILYALSWHGNFATWNIMVEILSDTTEAPLVRGQAAEGLSYLFAHVAIDSKSFNSGVSALLAALKDSSPEVRYCAVHALGATGHPPLVPYLKSMLEDAAQPPGWVGTVGEEASRAIEWLEGTHAWRNRGV